MKPAICVLLFLVMCMTNGWCKSQKFFPNGRYGRSDPSVPLIEYENGVDSLADEAADNEANGDKHPHKALSDNKLIGSLLSRSSNDKFKKQVSFLKGYSESFLLCLVANVAQGEPIKLVCKPLFALPCPDC